MAAATTEAVVIGGGIAGGAAAVHLARAGRRVIVFERTAGPHDKVCGEFVSGEAARYLCDLGIDLEMLGAVRISAVRLHSRNTVVSAALPFAAVSISRRVLDEAVLRAAAAAGAELRRGHAVKSLRPNGDGWTVERGDGSLTEARDVFLATGKHDLKGWKRPPSRDDMIAFKMHWRLAPEQAAALSSFVELFLFPGGYAGLERAENGLANLCLVVRRSHFARLGNRWEFLLSALRADFLTLHQRLAGAEPRQARPLAITSIPYGFVQTRGSGSWRSPWRLGDQAAVIPSFAGDGIAIALHSARLAAAYFLGGRTSAEFQSRFACEVTAQVRRATLLSRVLLHPSGCAFAMAAARLAPAAVGHVAHHTRIPSWRLLGPERQKVGASCADVERVSDGSASA